MSYFCLGDPFILMKVLRALIFETYPQVSRLLLDRGCVQTCTDKKILNGLFDHLRENAKYSCPLTVDQFLSKQSFAEHKLLVIAAVSEWVESCKEKPKAAAIHSESIFRNKLHVDHPDGTPQAFYKSRAGSAPRIKRDISVPTTPASPKQLDLSNLQNMATPNVRLEAKSEIRLSTTSERREKEALQSSVDTEALVQKLFEDFETKLLGVIDSRIDKISKDIDAKFTVLEARLKYVEGTLKSHQASAITSPQAPPPPVPAVTSTSLADRLVIRSITIL
jgi:hypothetical protein